MFFGHPGIITEEMIKVKKKKVIYREGISSLNPKELYDDDDFPEGLPSMNSNNNNVYILSSSSSGGGGGRKNTKRKTHVNYFTFIFQ
jgi:hypothetical protein